MIICKNCGEEIFAGQPVHKQGGPHSLCSDPDLVNHKRILKIGPDGCLWFGFINDDGKPVWLGEEPWYEHLRHAGAVSL